MTLALHRNYLLGRNFAEQLLNNRPQMRASSATEKCATQTKQMKIGRGEQVRVNQQTAAFNVSFS
jgi:hypothetical protein